MSDKQYILECLTDLKKLLCSKVEAIDYEGQGDMDKKELAEHLDIALNALRKQIPKECETNTDEDFYLCPNCKKDLMGAYGEIEMNPVYCCYCGQKLSWEVEEK